MIRWRKKVEEYVELRRSLGFKLLDANNRLDPVRLVSRTESRDTHYDCAGDEMGAAGQECASRRMGQAAQFRSRLCSPLERS